MANALSTPEIDLNLIDIVDDFNARKKVRKDELEELAGTIEETSCRSRSGPRTSAGRDAFQSGKGQRRAKLLQIERRRVLYVTSGIATAM